VQSYLSGIGASSSSITISESQHHANFNGASLIRLSNVTLANARNQDFSVRWREPIHLELTLQVTVPSNNVVFGVTVVSAEGVILLGAHSTDTGDLPHDLTAGEHVLRVNIENPLAAGTYTICVGSHNAISRDILFLVLEAATLEVLDVSVDDRPYFHKNRVFINTDATWQIAKSEDALLPQG